jgi:hypothetical protein
MRIKQEDNGEDKFEEIKVIVKAMIDLSYRSIDLRQWITPVTTIHVRSRAGTTGGKRLGRELDKD